MPSTAIELKRLKEKLDEGLRERSEAEGSLKAHTKRLKDEFGCGSIAETKKKLQKMKKELAEIDSEIDTGIEELEEGLR